MKTASDFREFYDAELSPVLARLEVKRRGIVRSFWRTVLIAGALAAAGGGTLVLMYGAGALVFCAIAGAVLVGLVTAVAWWALTKDFKLQFKSEVVGRVVGFCDPSLRYRARWHVSEGAFSESRIFLTGVDRYRGEDYVSGRLGETEIQFSELHAEYRTRSRDSKGHTRTSYHTIFKGLFCVAEFNKNFRGVTVVLPDLAEKAFGWLGQKLQEWNIARREELVKLEDPEFERRFVVYGSDQVEARYILSASLMRRIIDFQDRVDAKVFLSFVRSSVYVAIACRRDLFEPRILRPVDDYSLVKEYLADLELALGIVEDLDLNTRIWTKE